MTDKREQIALAAPHGVDPLKVPGGTPDFTAEDVAGQMGMGHLTQLQGSMLLYKYAGQGEISSIYLEFYAELNRIHPEWFDTDRVLGPIMSATVEHLGTNRCKRCNGTKEALIDGKMVLCDGCGGSGYYYEPHDYKGIQYQQYQYCVAFLRNAEQLALDALN